MTDSYAITTRAQQKQRPTKTDTKLPSQDPRAKSGTIKKSYKDGSQSRSSKTPPSPPSNLHVHISDEVVLNFRKGYKNDKDFALLITRTLEEPQDARKYHAYRISNNGLLYFEDADHKAQLCILASE